MELGGKFNCFVGNNGSGKTTVLDALHYLSVCKSFLNPIDSQNIRNEDGFFLINGTFDADGEEVDISCAVKREGKKQFKKNKKEYKRLIDHVGRFPSVVIAPTDADIINGGSELRRKFLDSMIGQLDRPYLESLVRYNKALQQRNALLKQFAEQRSFDHATLAVWDMQLVKYGEEVHRSRKRFLETFVEEFGRYYQQLSGGAEKLGIDYRSQLNEAGLEQLLDQSRNKDRAATYTTQGIHKDDLLLTINDMPLKRFGSQGQQKTALVGLKLAQFKVMHERSGVTPLLLLDDIFDKLDDERVGELLQLVGGGGFGQIFITDTHPERVAGLLKAQSDVRVFSISQGEVTGS